MVTIRIRSWRPAIPSISGPRSTAASNFTVTPFVSGATCSLLIALSSLHFQGLTEIIQNLQNNSPGEQWQRARLTARPVHGKSIQSFGSPSPIGHQSLSSSGCGMAGEAPTSWIGPRRDMNRGGLDCFAHGSVRFRGIADDFVKEASDSHLEISQDRY
jgi:hypothetical protein